MKKNLYLTLLFCLSFLACQSDSSTEQNQVQATQPTQKIENTTSTTEVTTTNSTNTKTGTITKEKPKSTFNAGKANKLGLQFGKRYCKCMNDGGQSAKCEETILKSMKNMEKAIDPRIMKALQRAYDTGKANCK